VIDQPDSAPVSSIVACSCGGCRNATATMPQAIVRAMTARAAKTNIVIGALLRQLSDLLADGRRLQRMDAPRCGSLRTSMTFIIRSRTEPVTGRNSTQTWAAPPRPRPSCTLLDLRRVPEGRLCRIPEPNSSISFRSFGLLLRKMSRRMWYRFCVVTVL
jgi:hypothetical protein